MNRCDRDDLAEVLSEVRESQAHGVGADDSQVDKELHDVRHVIELLDRVGARMARDAASPGGVPAESDLAGLLGDFVLLRVIGRGGMGVVYEAMQKSLNRRVALKILPAASADDPRKVKRFLIEAQAAACLRHPHIVPVYLVGSENGQHYYAMQFIEGRTLARLIDERRRFAEPAPPAQTALATPSPQRADGARRASEGACVHSGESPTGVVTFAGFAGVLGHVLCTHEPYPNTGDLRSDDGRRPFPGAPGENRAQQEAGRGRETRAQQEEKPAPVPHALAFPLVGEGGPEGRMGGDSSPCANPEPPMTGDAGPTRPSGAARITPTPALPHRGERIDYADDPRDAGPSRPSGAARITPTQALPHRGGGSDYADDPRDAGPTRPSGAARITPTPALPHRGGGSGCADDPAARSAAHPSRDRRYIRNAAELGRQAAVALHYAHQQGIIHRDIKPSNLLIDDSGWLWVGDFGLARIAGQAELTLSGTVVGTLRYMSPEQAFGTKGVVDHRTDIYSLGATLYELLTLCPVFECDDRLELLRRISDEEPSSPQRIDPAIPRDLDTIVRKAMAKDPGERYATAGELAIDLGRFLENRPILARPPSAIDLASKWVRRHKPAAAGAAIILILVVIGLAGGAYWRDRTLRGHNRALSSALKRAEEHESATRRLLYDSQMSLAHQSLASGHVEFAQEILDSFGPSPGGLDPRGFEWHYLRRLCHRELSLLSRQEKQTTAIALAPDGKTLVTGHADGVLVFWDLVAGRERTRVQAHDGHVHGLLFSPDARIVVSTGWDHLAPGQVTLWDPVAARPLFRVPGIEGYIAEQAFAARGSVLVLDEWDHYGRPSKTRLVFWDLAGCRTSHARCAARGQLQDGSFRGRAMAGHECELGQSHSERPEDRRGEKDPFQTVSTD